MFREMRRKKQLLSERESIEILMQGTSGVLALIGDEYPYAVPISYVYDHGKLFFHSAKNGHKIDAIRKCQKASFCVIAQDQIVPEKYTTLYQSVIAFGSIRILTEEKESYEAIKKLAMKYYPLAGEENRDQVILREWNSLRTMEMTIEHMSGKAAFEIIQKQ